MQLYCVNIRENLPWRNGFNDSIHAVIVNGIIPLPVFDDSIALFS